MHEDWLWFTDILKREARFLIEVAIIAAIIFTFLVMMVGFTENVTQPLLNLLPF